ncbi:hypothetical protein J7J95_00035 [bacterium]|nr:hypothetical protein [bacterium]
MKYEEKLDIILEKIAEERKLTRKGHKTKLTFSYYENDTGIDFESICKILLKLQDDEGVIEIIDILEPAETISLEQITKPSIDNDCGKAKIIFIEVNENFDEWYANYLLKQKSKVENLDWLNLLKVLDVCSDIDQQLQITGKTTVIIPSFPYPYIGRFTELFPYDSIGTRKSYQKYRQEGIQYLLKQEVILDASYERKSVLEYSNIIVRVDPVKFDDFYKRAQNEFKKRKKTVKKKKELKAPTGKAQIAEEKGVWPDDFRWEGKNFVFGKYGSISFKSKDRERIFKVLTSKKGGWATIRELMNGKNASYVRSTIKQIEDRFPKEVKKHVKIVSTQEDDFGKKPNVGAYRIKVQL